MIKGNQIIKVQSVLLVVEGIAMLLSLLVAVFYQEPDQKAFIQSSIITLATGGILYTFTHKSKTDIGKREAYIIVSLTWVVVSFFGSLPYLLSNSIPNLTDAFFETMSGFTTTGSSVLNDIEALPHGILFWRSITQWLGGMGIIVLSLAILPIFGIGGMQLFVAEVPGPTPDKLHPRVSQTSKKLWNIYLIFTIVETILLRIGGMNWFDAICHSFTTMATGGYSTKQASIAHWDSPFIHYVTILFMFIAGTNFSLSFYAMKGKFSKLIQNEEFKYYFLFTLGFAVIITFGLYQTSDSHIELSFRNSLFQVVSIITTTGFATDDYLLWITPLSSLLFALFFFGGSAGSTGGGIKIVRIVLLLKNSYYELRRLIHPKAVIPVRFNTRAVPDHIITNILAFFMLYLLIFGLSTVIFTFLEPDFDSSMGAVASCLGNIGPGLGTVGPAENFYHINPTGKWFLSFLMLLGRLELFTVLVLFTREFWKR